MAKTILSLRADMVKYGKAQEAMNASFAAFFKDVTPEAKLAMWAGVLKDIKTDEAGEEVAIKDFTAAMRKEYKGATTAKSRYEASLATGKETKEKPKGFWGQRRANADKELGMIQKVSGDRAASADVGRITAAYRELLRLLPK